MPYYSPEFKAEALAMMEEKGAVTTIKELGISSYTDRKSTRLNSSHSV